MAKQNQIVFKIKSDQEINIDHELYPEANTLPNQHRAAHYDMVEALKQRLKGMYLQGGLDIYQFEQEVVNIHENPEKEQEKNHS